MKREIHHTIKKFRLNRLTCHFSIRFSIDDLLHTDQRARGASGSLDATAGGPAGKQIGAEDVRGAPRLRSVQSLRPLPDRPGRSVRRRPTNHRLLRHVNRQSSVTRMIY